MADQTFPGDGVAACPVCNRPVSTTHHGGRQLRTYCSKRCAAIGGAQRRNADVDEVIVGRLVQGNLTASTKAERMQAVATLTGRGYSQGYIASRLHLTRRTVCRLRREHRLWRDAEGHALMGPTP